MEHLIPKIILITGASHTGKTLLAQRLLERYRMPYLSIDHLKMGLIRSGHTELTPLSDTAALTDYLWPIVREMIKTALENNQRLIVEGCYIPFDWRQDFDDNSLSAIRFVCLAMSDAYIASHFDDISAHASDIESRMDDDCTLEGLKEDNHAVIEGFGKCGERVAIIDGDYKNCLYLLENERYNKVDKSITQTERIAQMETLFDSSYEVIRHLRQAIDDFHALQPVISELENYYRTDWRSDFEADEEGALPADLKRGVLSEDGLWDLLEEYQQLKSSLEERE